MTPQRPFTARLDRHGLHVTFDDDTSRIYRDASIEQVARILDELDSEPATFTAATVASFAEAEHALPNPVPDGPLVDLARARTSTTRGADRIALGPLVTEASQPLAEVLEHRQSQRHLDPPSLEDLATVLVRSGRIIDWDYDDRGVETSYRPYPSAGAVHPLTIDVIADDVAGLAPGCWEFDPFRCDLTPSRHTAEAINRARTLITAAANVPTVPASLVLIANPARTLQRYPNGTAHLWRDAGVLLATLHLAASDIGLGSSIVGTSGALKPFAPSDDGTVDVGSLVLGRPAT